VLTPPQAGVPITSLAVRQNAEGCLVVVALGADNAVYAIAQTTPNNGWGAWASLGVPTGVSVDSLAVGSNQDGRLQVFAIGTDHNLPTLWETTPSVWSDWGVVSPANNLGTGHEWKRLRQPRLGAHHAADRHVWVVA
jgi:hypothetical protein